MPAIPKSECNKGWLYRIHSRNLEYGVYDGEGGFIGIREKFHSRYLFTEYHVDNGPPFGTVRPIEALEQLPEAIPASERIDPPSICVDCGVGVAWKQTDPEKKTGVWYHLAETNCPEAYACVNDNRALFDWLVQKETQYGSTNYPPPPKPAG